MTTVPCMDVSALALAMGLPYERVAISMAGLSILDRREVAEHQKLVSNLLFALLDRSGRTAGAVERAALAPGMEAVEVKGTPHRWFVLDIASDAKVIVTIWDLFGANAEVVPRIVCTAGEFSRPTAEA